MDFQRPSNVPDHAELCLKAISDANLGDKISLGGAFGLLHYLDYRATYDVDAWWASSATSQERQMVIDAVIAALTPLGKVRTREWGDVVSIELGEGKRKVFSFQIAQRSAQLQPSTPLLWVDSLLDSLDDLIASKMVALVERGAPRDFRDIYAVCQAGLVTVEQCWELWRRRQTLAHSDADRERANLALQIHLERIAVHRPLEQITDPSERVEANRLRLWFSQEFIHVS
ncbi:MAG: nucleotidyl transferase AbiEii/AbiGii toxin family protein [Anaerolinea sp.]|nr:nucleotidyl transferase AbiEii/AbiGii toxin family protein [Anaerolinea sp.]